MSVAKMAAEKLQQRKNDMADVPPWEIVRMLEELPGKNDKAALLNTLPEDHEFWRGASLARDNMITFGVKKLPTVDGHFEQSSIPWEVFEYLCNQLARRELTGNAAKEQIEVVARESTKEQWDYWYSRILHKKLRCGADKTINEAAPERWKVKPFSCQLAADGNKALPHHWPKEAYVEAKYDGTRAVFFINPNGEHKAFSRNGKEWLNFGPVQERLARLLEHPKLREWGGVVVDGEMMGENFQKLMKEARRLNDAKVEGMYLMAFDILPMSVYKEQEEWEPLHVRRNILEDAVDWLNELEPDHDITVAVSDILKDVDPKGADLERVEEFYIEQLGFGLEGIVTKDKNHPYVFDRHRSWIKTKPNDSVDLTIVGVEPGKPDGKYCNTLGALVCEGVDDGQFIRVNVGGGLTDKFRDVVWSDPEAVIGRVVEIKYDGEGKGKKSLAEDADHYSLRFPRFKRFREDKED